MTNGTNKDWGQLLKEAASKRESSLEAVEHAGGFQTATRPQRLRCGADRELFVVKFKQNTHGDGRGIFTEQIVARAAVLVGAPVPAARVIEVPDDIVESMRADSSLGLDTLCGLRDRSYLTAEDAWSLNDAMSIAQVALEAVSFHADTIAERYAKEDEFPAQAPTFEDIGRLYDVVDSVESYIDDLSINCERLSAAMRLLNHMRLDMEVQQRQTDRRRDG